ncbi:MAG: LamG-like jellyroll fold domain-containing protein, partial [Polyangiaceae bacterium]
MVRPTVLVSSIVVLMGGCSLFANLDGLQSGSDAGSPQDAAIGNDAPSAADTGSGTDSSTAIDSGADAATCTCTNLLSAYRFGDPSNLGHDFMGNNNMTSVQGTPTQSSITPDGLPGHSIALDGASSVCIPTGFTFDSTADHTLCWWTQPAALANNTNQFAQQCGYDTWTTNSGADYLWHINNCNTGTQSDLQVPNLYQVGTWVQICQTYDAASLTRSVTINGDSTSKISVTDTAPILEDPTANWCIGSYGSGGYWTGLIYLPMWFDRILTDDEIANVSKNA